MMPCVTFPFISFNFIIMVGQIFIEIAFHITLVKTSRNEIKPNKPIKIQTNPLLTHIRAHTFQKLMNLIRMLNMVMSLFVWKSSWLIFMSFSIPAMLNRQAFSVQMNRQAFSIQNIHPSYFNPFYVSNPSHLESIPFLNHRICNPFYFLTTEYDSSKIGNFNKVNSWERNFIFKNTTKKISKNHFVHRDFELDQCFQ